MIGSKEELQIRLDMLVSQYRLTKNPKHAQTLLDWIAFVQAHCKALEIQPQGDIVGYPW
jgi:hypothetical protein